MRDNYTTLVWEVKTNDGSIHDRNTTYFWGGNTALGKNHPNREGNYHNDWNSLVDGSNNANLCGFNDWRVPTRESLFGLIDYSEIGISTGNAISLDYFPNVDIDGVDNKYWSSSPAGFTWSNLHLIWVVDFVLGEILLLPGGYTFGNTTQYNAAGVRLVRGVQ